jgi:hypothetical protein
MVKNVAGYVVALVASLGFAYYASMPQDNSDKEAVDWISIDEGNIAAVTMQTPESKVRAEAKDGGYWMSVEKAPKKEEPKDESEPKEAVNPLDQPLTAEAPEVTRFKGNQRMKDFVKSFAPLKAYRVIGKLQDLKAEEFGLDGEPKQVVEVEMKNNDKYRFVVGKKSFGSSNVFLLDEKKGEVILVKGGPIDNLAKAELRMFEREVMSLDPEDMSAATIRKGEVTARWDHSSRSESGELQWKKEGHSAAHKAFANWIDKISKLRLTEFADESKVESLSTLPPVFEIDLASGMDKAENIVVVKVEGEGNKGAEYWIKSKFLGTFAKLDSARMENLAKDLDGVLSSDK